MLRMKIIFVSCGSATEHVNTLYGNNAGLLILSRAVFALATGC
jgi:hypothetical protein